MITDSFKGDILFISNKLSRNDCFSFSKFADGEYAIISGQSITNIDGWNFDNDRDHRERSLLIEAFQYSSENYYIGICCPCCAPTAVNWMRESHNSNGRVTWANIFVNSNYQIFCEYILPNINAWPGKVNIVASEKGIGKSLPIKVNTYIPIGQEAWKMPHAESIIAETAHLARKSSGQLFLFCAGPLGNMLAYKLHQISPDNTYLDIGSTLNRWLVGNNRGYLIGGMDKTKVCIW
jgi:hypothetical protein